MSKIFQYLLILFLYTGSLSLYSFPEKEEKKIRDLIQKKYGFIISKKDGDSYYLFKLVLKWEGVPFLLGGHSNEGIGNSELITEIAEKVYFRSIEGSPSSMFRKIKLRKKGEVPEQGDLVFFKNTRGDVIHVGMYLKESHFLHTSAKTGVIVEKLSEPEYSESFYAFGKIRTCGN